MPDAITLADGRSLAYDQHGALDGVPIFFFHGNPGSRLMRHPDESIATKMGARIITVDRPGYGYSTFQKKRMLLHWPDDVAALADALKIERFAVCGVSAGAPYVAATAFRLPQRVVAAAMVSGPAPFNRLDPYEGVNETYVTAYKTARWPQWLLRVLLYITIKRDIADPEAALQRSYDYISAADRELLNQTAFREQVKGYRAEAARDGVKGMAREAKILVAPWGFNPAQITVPMHLWYWEDDTLVPLQMGLYLEAHIPNTIPHFMADGGHFSVFTHWRDILEPLVAAFS